MKSDDVVLGILLESPSTGYEIKQKFETVFRHFYNASFGSIYPILHKLVTHEKVDVDLICQEGKPDKKIYSITEKGIESFQSYLRTEVEPRKTKWDFMVRMYFADSLPAYKQLELIDREIAKQRDELEQLLELQKSIDATANTFQKFSLHLGITQKEAFLYELNTFRNTISAS